MLMHKRFRAGRFESKYVGVDAPRLRALRLSPPGGDYLIFVAATLYPPPGHAQAPE